MAQQKGTELALCLNSANRDVAAYPDSNDFVLDLKDRYLHQERGPAAPLQGGDRAKHPWNCGSA